jgi:tRNA(Ile)-lysidine synthase
MPLRTVEAFLEARLTPDVRRLVLACSGGLDSVALLHLLSALRPRFDRELHVVHVHHGLHHDAGRWLAHVEGLAARHGAGFSALRVKVDSGGSLEDAARTARYQAIAGILRPGDVLLTAHHQNDQAETVLLRLLRGSGVTGLGGMSPSAAVPCIPDHFPLWRPLLTVPRPSLEAYARRHALVWVEDDANQDPRHARNFLRAQVLPLLQTRWPQALPQLAETARRMRESDALLTDLARLDWESVASADDAMPVAALLTLSPERQLNLLRFWLQRQGLPAPDRAALRRMVDEVCRARQDATPCFLVGGLEVRRYRDRLYAMRPKPDVEVNSSFPWQDRSQALLLPDGRRLSAQAVAGQGIRSDLWRQARRVDVRFRQGGERLHLAGRPGRKPLKDMFQEAGIPPWQRPHWPLIWLDDRLAAVPGLAVDADFLAVDETPGILIT